MGASLLLSPDSSEKKTRLLWNPCAQNLLPTGTDRYRHRYRYRHRPVYLEILLVYHYPSTHYRTVYSKYLYWSTEYRV